MTQYFVLFISTIVINNFIFKKFASLCPFLDVSKKLETAIGMGIVTSFVITLTCICVWLIDHLILIPLNLAYLRTTDYILVIATLIQFIEIVLRKINLLLYRFIGIFLPLIITNCTLLSILLLHFNANHTFLQSIFYSCSSALSFTVVMFLFSSMHERIMLANVPRPFKGESITLITAGLMAMTFMGFNGLVKI